MQQPSGLGKSIMISLEHPFDLVFLNFNPIFKPLHETQLDGDQELQIANKLLIQFADNLGPGAAQLDLLLHVLDEYLFLLGGGLRVHLLLWALIYIIVIGWVHLYKLIINCFLPIAHSTVAEVQGWNELVLLCQWGLLFAPLVHPVCPQQPRLVQFLLLGGKNCRSFPVFRWPIPALALLPGAGPVATGLRCQFGLPG